MPERMKREAANEAERRIEEADFRRAKTLALSSLGLTELPDSLFKLRRLQNLDVEDNQLTALPDSLTELTQLQRLDVSRNQIAVLPDFLGDLTELRELVIAYNPLNRLPESIGKLTRLEKLVARENRLDSLPESLGLLSQLNELLVDQNQLVILPESIGALNRLQKLVIARNQLKQLPESIGRLTALRELVLAENQLTNLPESMRQLWNLRRLYLHGNPKLGMPPEILGPIWPEVFLSKPTHSATAILDYFFRTQRASRPLNEAKLILVGRGGVGKTSLIKRLVHGTFQEHEPETSGVNIEPWEVTLPDGDPVRLHVWDFGGQRILHGTHQFFLTERTLYLLVLSGREDSATQDAEYWLQLIKSFGGDSPVIIALNKSKKHPFDVNRGLLLEK